MGHSDKAITSPEEDKLNRLPFIDNLKNLLIRWDKPDSIIIGLFGPWGSGKTSIINLTIFSLLNYFKTLPINQQPIIIYFNPWNITDKDQLLRSFFQQIYSELSKVQSRKTRRNFRKQLSILSRTLGSLGQVPFAGIYLSISSKLIEIFSSEKSLNDQKKDLQKTFLDINRKIIIVIDDIDRLTEDEIRLVFQIIKINADFPNTIYLTAFDRNLVEKSLSSPNLINGKAYLEKIIQIGIDIPKIEIDNIYKFLLSELDRIISESDSSFDDENWPNYFHSGFKDLFTSIRDVKRYINSLEITINLISDEINLLDFFVIEALRIFMPEVYDLIEKNELPLLYTGTTSRNDSTKEEYKVQIESILKANNEYDYNLKKRILYMLFPQIEIYYSNITSFYGYVQGWRKDKRICVSQFFRTYFLFTVPSSNISQKSIRRFIESINGIENTVFELERVFFESKLDALLIGLKDNLSSIQEKMAKDLIESLLITSQKFPNNYIGLFDLGLENRQLNLAVDLLRNLENTERFSWFRNLLIKNVPLSSSYYLIGRSLQEQIGTNSDKLFTEEQLSELKTIWLSNLHSQVVQVNFLRQRNISRILVAWREWETDSKLLDNFLTGVCDNYSLFLDFLEGFINVRRSETVGEYKIHEERRLNINVLKTFVDLERIQAIYMKIGESDLLLMDDENKKTYAFLKTVNWENNDEF